jgi:hypothetical protein
VRSRGSVGGGRPERQHEQRERHEPDRSDDNDPREHLGSPFEVGGNFLDRSLDCGEEFTSSWFTASQMMQTRKQCRVTLLGEKDGGLLPFRYSSISVGFPADALT